MCICVCVHVSVCVWVHVHGRTQPSGERGGGSKFYKRLKGDLSSRKIMDYVIRPIQWGGA